MPLREQVFPGFAPGAQLPSFIPLVLKGILKPDLKCKNRR